MCCCWALATPKSCRFRHRPPRRRPPHRFANGRDKFSSKKGESTTLTWETTNATDVQIDGVGPVNPTGSRQVTPTDSTTYRLVAAKVRVSQEATRHRRGSSGAGHDRDSGLSLAEEQQFNQNVKDIYFVTTGTT